MQPLRTCILVLGAPLLLVGGCSGSAFTVADYEPHESNDPLDASSERGTDGGADASRDADSTAEDASDGNAELPDAGDGGDDEAGGGVSDASDGGDEDTCVSVTWYLDEDGDGWGGAITSEGCAPPSGGKWAEEGGDCHDGNADVHPGQQHYFQVAYEIADGSGTKSFDYDCDGKELNEGSPKTTKGCSLLDGLCRGDGYLPVSPGRPGGASVNQHCGSMTYLSCSLAVLSCAETKSTFPAIRCR